MGMSTSSALRCADVQDGICYEIERERVNLLIASKVDQMSRAGTLGAPTEEDLAELKRLEALRGNGRRDG